MIEIRLVVDDEEALCVDLCKGCSAESSHPVLGMGRVPCSGSVTGENSTERAKGEVTSVKINRVET
jgi:hypothetical protein